MAREDWESGVGGDRDEKIGPCEINRPEVNERFFGKTVTKNRENVKHNVDMVVGQTT